MFWWNRKTLVSIKVNGFSLWVQFKILFSLNLRHFDNITETKDGHHWGKLEIFNGELMAIAGNATRAVEIMTSGHWGSIKPVGNINGKLYWFSSLTIPGNPSDTLFVFGIHILTFYSFLTISIRGVWKLLEYCFTWDGEIDRWGLAIRQPAVGKVPFTPNTSILSQHCSYWRRHIAHWWR